MPRLHVPQPPTRPGDKPDFSYVDQSPAGAIAKPDVNARARDMEECSRRPGARAGRQTRGRGPVESAPGRRRPAGGPAPHAADAHLRRPHAAHAAPGKDLLLYALLRRGGRGRRVRHGAAARRHAVPVVPAAGHLHGARQAHGRPHVPAAVQHARHVQGPAVAGDVPLEGRQHLLDLRQSNYPVPAGGGLGHGRRDPQRGSHRLHLDRRRRQRRGGFPSRPAVRRRLPGAGDHEHRQQPVGHFDVPGHRRRRAALVRGARSGLRRGGHSRRRQRFPGGTRGHAMGRAACAYRRRADADRARDLPCRGAFHQRRSFALPSQGGLRALAAG